MELMTRRHQCHLKIITISYMHETIITANKIEYALLLYFQDYRDYNTFIV